MFDDRSYLCVYFWYRVQVQNDHVDKVVANVTLIYFVDIALFYIFWNFE